MLNAIIKPPQAKPTKKYDKTFTLFKYSGFKKRYGTPYLAATFFVIKPNNMAQKTSNN